jgi:outer membrane biogenesis lipoprotein LolB
VKNLVSTSRKKVARRYDIQTAGEIVARVVIVLILLFACSGKMSVRPSQSLDHPIHQASVLKTSVLR